MERKQSRYRFGDNLEYMGASNTRTNLNTGGAYKACCNSATGDEQTNETVVTVPAAKTEQTMTQKIATAIIVILAGFGVGCVLRQIFPKK